MTETVEIAVTEKGVAQVVSKVNTLNTSLATTKGTATGMSSSAITSFGNMAKSLGLITTATMIAKKAFDLFKQSIDEAQTAELAQRKLANAISNSALAAEITTKQMQDMAGELEGISNFGDEDIMQGVSQSLLKYRSISKDVFQQAHKDILDLAEAMGGGEGSLDSASKLVGMALEDPINGLSRLRRAGVTFTQSEQDRIKALMEAGKATEAQVLVLQALETRFAGAAQAGVTSANQLKNAWGNYLEALGNQSLQLKKSLEVGLTSFITAQTAMITSSQQQMDQAMQESATKRANAVSGTLITLKYSLTAIAGVVQTAIALIADGVNGILTAVHNLRQGITGTFKGVWAALDVLPAQTFEAIGGLTSLKDAFETVKDSFTGGFEGANFKDLVPFSMTKEAIANWKGMLNNITSETDAAVTLNNQKMQLLYNAPTFQTITPPDTDELTDALGTSSEKSIEIVRNMQKEMIDAWAAYYQTIDQYSTESVNFQAAAYKQQLQDQYGNTLSATQIDEMYNAKLWELRDGQLAHIRDNNQAELDALTKLNNDKLSAQLAYIQAVNPLSQAYINTQLDAYRVELEAYTQLGLSKMQIDEMVNAKRLELTKTNNEALIANWQETNQVQTDLLNAFGSSFQSSMNEVFRIETDTNNAIEKAFVGLINTMIAEVNKLIVKLMLAAIFKQLAFGIAAPAAAGGAGVPAGFFDLPGFGAVTSAGGGTGGMNNIIAPSLDMTANNNLLMAVNDNISGLRNDLGRTGLTLRDSDGTPLMKFVKQAETRYRAL